MANIDTTYNYITSDRRYEVVNFLRDNYKELTKDVPDTEEGNKQIYNMAPAMFPKYKFADWEEDYYRNYPESAESIDTSVESIDELSNIEDAIYKTALSHIPPNELKETLEKFKATQPKSEIYQVPINLEDIMFGNLQSNREDVFGELVMKYLPKEWQEDLKLMINNRAAGHNYKTRTGEDKYEIDPSHEYDPSWGHNLVNTFLATGVYDLANFVVSGKIAKSLGALKGVKQYVNWASSRTADYMGKILPNSKLSNSLREFFGKYYDPKKAGEQIFDLGQSVGFTHAVWGATESAANQRGNSGKYATNDGTINTWDLIVDSAVQYGEGVALGSALGIFNNKFDAVYKYSNPRWLKGQRDFKTVAGKIISNPVSKYGSHGITWASMPLIWDKERRAQYVDEDGNVKYGKWAGDVLSATGASLVYVGMSQSYGNVGNLGAFKIKGLSSKKFLAKLSDQERAILRKKVSDMTAGRGKDKKFEEWWKDFTANEKEGPSIISNLIRGKGKLPVTLKEKLKTFIGIRPQMPWDRNGKLYSETLPDEISIPKKLFEIRNQVKKDILYEKSKNTKTSLMSDEQKLINTSLQNVSRDLGGTVPYEFFEKDINKSNKDIDMGDGLKTIYDIADKSLGIIDKITIKDNEGNPIGVDNSKLTNEDAFFLHAYTPSVISAYQGYKDTYLNTQEGIDSYIKRYEVEENNGVPLTENQKKLLISVAKNQVDKLDIMREYYNRKSLDGSTENEQVPVAKGDKKPKLSPKYQKVVFLDKDRLPTDGFVHNIDKSEADRLIESGRALKVKDAEKKGLQTNVIDSPSQGNNKNISELGQLTQEVKTLRETIELGEKAKDNVTVTNKKFNVIKAKLGAETDNLNNTINVENNILSNKIKNYKDKKDKQIISDTRIDGITDVIDIWGLEKLSVEDLDKWISPANRLIKHSGNNSFSEITQEDIRKYFNDRIKEKRKLKQIPAIDDGERSSLNNIFRHLSSKIVGAIDENPYTKILTKPYTKKYNEIKDLFKKRNPELKIFYEGLGRIKKIAANIGKGITPEKKISTAKFIKEDKGRLSVALELISDFPIRDLEINALMPKLVQQYPTGQWYIDFLTPRSEGGARKTLGVPRPIPITESMAKKIFKLGKVHGMNTELFPEYAGVITKLLQSELGGKITSKVFKSQLKIVAERFSGLSDRAIHTLEDGREIVVNEISIYNVLAGHAKADDKSIQQVYTNPANFGDFFDMAIPIMEKVKQGIKSFIKKTPTTQIVPVEPTPISPIGKVIKKITKKIEETGGGIALGIKDISDKSDNEVINVVNKSKNVPIKNKKFKDKYVKALNNEFNKQTEKWSDENKEELVQFYAKKAHILDFDNLTVYNKSTGKLEINSDTDIDNLVLLSERILAGSQNIINNRLKVYKVQDNVEKAHRIGDAAKISMDDRREIIKRRFGKTNFLSLTQKESFEYLKEMKLNNDNVDKYDWWQQSLLEKEFQNLQKKVPPLKAFLNKIGASGQAREVFEFLEKKYGMKGLIKIYNNLSDHLAHEVRVQGWLNDFEYKAAHIMSTDKLRISLRQLRARWKEGVKEFDKIKNDLFWIQENMWKELSEFVEMYPQFKDIKAIHTRAKKFIDKVYEKEGVLRIDTPESKIAKLWYEHTEKIKQSYIDGFKANMTEMQWNTFNKKHPIQWIENTFYVTNAVTKEFADEVELDSKAMKLLIQKNQRDIAYERAFEKHQKSPNAKQVDEELAGALTEAYNRVIKLKQFTPAKIKAKYLASRKFKAPPILMVKGKPILVWDTSWNAIGPQAIAGQAKLSATIRYLHYLLDMQGLPGNFKNIPKIVADLSAKGGSVGQYISGMIYSRAGISQYSLGPELKKLQQLLRQGNHYISRGHLAWYFSAIKNAGIGTSMNYSLWNDQQKDLAVALYRSMSWENRMDAKGKGIIQLALQSIETGWSPDNIIEKLFTSGKFKSSEEMTRLHASFMAILEMPKIVDILRTGKSHKDYNYAIEKLKVIYEASDEQIFLLKEHGLGVIERSDYNIKDTGLDTPTLRKLGIGVVNFKGEVLTDGFEIGKEQEKLDNLHHKLFTMAHINTQGATDPLFQPYLLQTPFVKEMMLYMQMARGGNSNINKILKLNKKHGNWYRTILGMGGVAGSWAFGSLLWGSALMGLKTLVTGMPNPNELEPKLWKKFLNAWIKGEILHYFTPMLKLAKGEVPKITDFVGVVGPQVSGEILSAFLDLIRYAIDELGFKPEGSSELANKFNYKRMPGQTIDDLARSLNSYYRNVRLGVINVRTKYFSKIQKMKAWEKEYLKKTNNPKVEVLTNNEMSSYNNTVIRLFEETDNYKKIAMALNDKWYAHKAMFMRSGYTDSIAGEMSSSEVEALIKRLDPLSIGLTADNRRTGSSKNDDFIMFLVKKAEEQEYKGDEVLKFAEELFDTRDMYNTKVDSVRSNYQYIVRNITDFKKEKDRKYFLSIKPPEWNDIGIKLNKGETYWDIKPETKKAILKKYEILVK